jgi:hypothetical protein
MATGVTIGTSGGNETIGAAYVGTSGGNKTVLAIYVGTSGGNETVYAALSAAISPKPATEISSAGPTTTDLVTATPTGGIGPFSYAWARVSGDPEISATTPSAQTTRFFANLGVGDLFSATFEVTVTDTSTGFTATDTVLVSISESS